MAQIDRLTMPVLVVTRESEKAKCDMRWQDFISYLGYSNITRVCSPKEAMELFTGGDGLKPYRFVIIEWPDEGTHDQDMEQGITRKPDKVGNAPTHKDFYLQLVSQHPHPEIFVISKRRPHDRDMEMFEKCRRIRVFCEPVDTQLLAQEIGNIL